MNPDDLLFIAEALARGDLRGRRWLVFPSAAWATHARPGAHSGCG